ncbi:MAG: hypothetical protein NVS4B11_06190 [Ktedonobacteraceae bacterium]
MFRDDDGCNQSPLPSSMPLSLLAAGCKQELDDYQRGASSNEQYCPELLRRTTVQRDVLAWDVLQQLFGEILFHWMRSHPKREQACQLDSEEQYVARALLHFQQAAIQHQTLEIPTLAAARQYLRVCLNGTILETLRTFLRPKGIPLPVPDDQGNPLVESQRDKNDIWEAIQSMLPNSRERRVAYLLFHCGLAPSEIIQYCPQEFGDAQEVYRLCCTIIERLLRTGV